MPRFLFAAILLIQAHFAASFLVPLDSAAQREFRGLLRWAWPWSDGDAGPLGEVTATSGVPLMGIILAGIAAMALVAAAMAVLGWWVPAGWGRPLTFIGAGSSVALLMLFFGATKILPIALALAIIWFAVSYWEASSWATVASD